MLPDAIKSISEQMIERYSRRYTTFGYDIKTLGWGSLEQQHCRFAMTLSAEMSFNNKTLIDIGCGFGDYYLFLKEKNAGISRYTGADINPDLINEARKMFHPAADANFEVSNLLETGDAQAGTYDIGVMLGLLNVYLNQTVDNYQYSKKMIEKAFKLVKKLLIVDFISSHLTDTYPREDFIFYHDPAEMLNIALGLSDNVTLKHNYAPIPQKEFMLFIYKT